MISHMLLHGEVYFLLKKKKGVAPKISLTREHEKSIPDGVPSL